MRMISSFVNSTPLRFERFHVLFSSCQRVSPMAQRQGSPPAVFWHLSTSVPCLWETRIRVTHGTDGATGISNFCLAFWIMASHSSTSSGRISWIFPFWCAGCIFVFFNIPLQICSLLSTLRHRRRHFWLNHFWSRCDLCFGQPAACELPWSGRLFKMRNLVHPLQLSKRILCPSMFPK